MERPLLYEGTPARFHAGSATPRAAGKANRSASKSSWPVSCEVKDLGGDAAIRNAIAAERHDGKAARPVRDGPDGRQARGAGAERAAPGKGRLTIELGKKPAEFCLEPGGFVHEQGVPGGLILKCLVLATAEHPTVRRRPGIQIGAAASQIWHWSGHSFAGCGLSLSHRWNAPYSLCGRRAGGVS